ncbi:MAG: MBL fold metallo-hydrolase [Acidobacteriota bacterium]
MRVVVLGSGSKGNAFVVEAGGSSSEPRRILVDAGFSRRQLELRMRAVGVEPETLSAVILTHEHSDHCRGIEVLAKNRGLPVFATQGTLDEISLPYAGQVLASNRCQEVGDGFEVEPFHITHDAREPVGFVVRDGAGSQVGLLADAGVPNRLALAKLASVDALLLECNHDLELLRGGPYPWFVKERIWGRHGHLSNRQAAESIPDLVNDRLQWIVAYHLSETNNRPELARLSLAEALEAEGCDAQIQVASQDRPSSWLEVSP